MTKKAAFEVDLYQYDALKAARDYWGRKWKSRLSTAWQTGGYPASLRSYSAELQQVRNSGGATWLQKFKFDS